MTFSPSSVKTEFKLGPNAAWRAEAIPDPAEVERRRLADEATATEQSLAKRKRRRGLPRRRSWCPWADLLERAFGVGGLSCPKCGSPLWLRAVVTGGAEAARIVASLQRSARGPPRTTGGP